ncbi:MAG: CCA tRNA nucleotidyltransferase, partial [bacterium]|nr:CCA tRNA nucleotidyltransferase [bacterium]
IDFIADLISAEQDLGWGVEMMARLQIMLPPNPEKMEELASRLKFSGLEKKRLLEWAKAELPNSAISKADLGKILYRDGRQAIHDRIRNEIVRQRHIARDNDEALVKAETFANLLDWTSNWQRPVFPLKGRDLRKAGMDGGPQMGEELKRLEDEWVDSGFLKSREELLAGLRV